MRLIDRRLAFLEECSSAFLDHLDASFHSLKNYEKCVRFARCLLSSVVSVSEDWSPPVGRELEFQSELVYDLRTFLHLVDQGEIDYEDILTGTRSIILNILDYLELATTRH